ncbi:unnamed protein product, partial [Discosporangium mesarthrocarpum]
WTLTSDDARLACPPLLASSVCSLVEDHGDELKCLLLRSLFVLPGREGLVSLSVGALREKMHLLFLVSLVPVLEPGLRALFCCANESPQDLFARQNHYYVTLDGYGQRAKHQLLLDQYLEENPSRPNLLLQLLGPGLSACLLDLFMMDAGPGLRGKVAHGETDLSEVFIRQGSLAAKDGCGGKMGGAVTLLAATFITLCCVYDPEAMPGHAAARAGVNGVEAQGDNLEGSSFRQALSCCTSLCMGWVTRFHPHEVLEGDLQECFLELGCLRQILGGRALSCHLEEPGGESAVMSVVVDPLTDVRAANGTGGKEFGEGN